MLRASAMILLGLGCVSIPAFGAGSLPAAAAGVAAPPQPGRNFTVALPAITMIWIAPGTFRMSNPLGAGDDTIVTLTHGYWLGRTEVTQAQWQALMESEKVFHYVAVPSRFKGSERPVEQISWEMAAGFCADLDRHERAAGRVPAGYAYALPTEAEWEFACRAGTTGKYAGDLAAMAWYDANSSGETHPVAQKQPNAWGFYDLHGNVREWCAEWYASYPGGRVSDPTGPATGVYHTMRGGDFGAPAGGCRSGLRVPWLSSISGFTTGFRLALAPVRPTPRPPDATSPSPSRPRG